MKQGEIILIPFPFTNLQATKTRPALVISKDNRQEDIILLGITSRKGVNVIEIDNADLSSGELPLTCYIKYSKVVTLSKSLARKTVAKLNRSILQKTLLKFKSNF